MLLPHRDDASPFTPQEVIVECSDAGIEKPAAFLSFKSLNLLFASGVPKMGSWAGCYSRVFKARRVFQDFFQLLVAAAFSTLSREFHQVEEIFQGFGRIPWSFHHRLLDDELGLGCRIWAWK